MIIKGKTRADIARQIGISKQAFCEKISKGVIKLYMDSDFNLCYDTDIPYARKNSVINYNPNYTGNFISRLEYSNKYNRSLSNITYLINQKRLYTDKYGKFVSDMPAITRTYRKSRKYTKYI